jgi:hydrogenase nickel incorporation protein HypA/HybF
VREVSICQALLKQVAAIAVTHGAIFVSNITVEVGPLAELELGLLARAFNFVRVGSCAADSTLSIESIPVTVGCLTCGAESQVAPNNLPCPHCGNLRTRIVAGHELRLLRVEMRLPEPMPAAILH